MGNTQHRYIPGLSKKVQGQEFGFSCDVDTHFSPKEKLSQKVKQELESAKDEVHASLYVLTNPELIKTLVDLEKRRVNVYLALDHHFLQTDRGKMILQTLIVNGIDVYIKRTNDLNHTKFAIIDNKILITGSWNWSKSADRQDNDMIITDCRDMILDYGQKFLEIQVRDRI